jgi:hypothetical protein
MILTLPSRIILEIITGFCWSETVAADPERIILEWFVYGGYSAEFHAWKIAVIAFNDHPSKG